MKYLHQINETIPLRDEPYGTIYELAGHQTGMTKVGLAWVDVDAGTESPLHYHRQMDEVYFVLKGAGIMQLGEKEFAVAEGDCVSIPVGIPHAIKNPGEGVLQLIVATGPAYSPEDDIVVETLP